jgi:translocator assembly and maintenance protein 41
MALPYVVSLHSIARHMHTDTSAWQRSGGLQCARFLRTSNPSRPIRHAPFQVRRFLASQPTQSPGSINPQASKEPSPSPASDSSKSSGTLKPSPTTSVPSDWEDNPNYSISQFSELPHSNFGVNQHIVINDEFKEALRQILWQFRAPIRYAFAYGSGVFPQSKPVRNVLFGFGAIWSIN